MVVRYSQRCSITQAVAQTFDGEHPCDLCKHIQQSKESDQPQREAPSISKKIDLRLMCAARMIFPPAKFDFQPVRDAVASTRAEPPPVPPPRLA